MYTPGQQRGSLSLLSRTFSQNRTLRVPVAPIQAGFRKILIQDLGLGPAETNASFRDEPVCRFPTAKACLVLQRSVFRRWYQTLFCPVSDRTLNFWRRFLLFSFLFSLFVSFFASFSSRRSLSSLSLFSFNSLACCGEIVSEACLLRYFRFADPISVKPWKGCAEAVLADV
jgi:hypothetical protein